MGHNNSTVNLECMASALRGKNLQKKNNLWYKEKTVKEEKPISLKHPGVEAKYSNISKSLKQSRAASSCR